METENAPIPEGIPPEAIPVLREVGYFEPDRLQKGQRVPPLTLSAHGDGAPVRIGDANAAMPTVLIFGSYT